MLCCSGERYRAIMALLFLELLSGKAKSVDPDQTAPEGAV